MTDRIDDFYFFMTKREGIRLAKEQGKPRPWTDDPILQKYKFTNVKREHDWTTQQFSRWYRDHVPLSGRPEVYLFNCAVARYIGRWETVSALGWTENFSADTMAEFLESLERGGNVIFTGAYVITNQGLRDTKINVVIRSFLQDLWDQKEEITEVAHQTDSWRATAKRMARITGYGGTGFMTKEILLDTMLTEGFWPNGEKPADFNQWSPAGPGARRGLNRLFGRRLEKNIVPKQALEEMQEIYEYRHNFWPLGWVGLDLSDIQFQLCEFDKYERVRLGEGRPRSTYTPRGEMPAKKSRALDARKRRASKREENTQSC